MAIYHKQACKVGRNSIFLLASLLAAQAQAAPQGGQITAGSASIAQGTNTIITQHSNKLAIDWQSFNIGKGESVTFQQPSAAAIALNRILGNDASQIYGQLNANGQVFLLNPNGVLFGKTAQVNVGGLVASTLGLSNTDFLNGNYSFNGASTASVSNLGSIIAAKGGYVALLGAEVNNSGSISAEQGNVSLAAGQQVTLNLANGSLLGLTVDKGAVKALADNGGLIQTTGGQTLLTAQAADQLTSAVVNNTGIIEAHSLANHAGKIELMGDMQTGTVNVGGTLDASAASSPRHSRESGNLSSSVDGGFIETSAAHVKVADGATITTKAANGNSGTWLIDPKDFTIGTDITGSTLSTSLGSGNVTIESSTGNTEGSGDINVNDAVSWSANTLTLTAARDININAVMTASDNAGLALNPASDNGADTAVAGGTVKVALGTGRVDFTGSGNSMSINGTPYTIITALGAENSTTKTDLQGIAGDLAGHYALGADIDASATSGWRSGFAAIGDNSSGTFTGVFDGLGHSIDQLTSGNVGKNFSGLFGEVTGGEVRNLALTRASITGFSYVGALVGYATDAHIRNVSSNGSVEGADQVGGLIGYAVNSDISQVSSAGSVTNTTGDDTGGLVGQAVGSTRIDSASSSATVVGSQHVGGLVGQNSNNFSASGSSINNSRSTGAVSGAVYVGGLVGYNDSNGSISNSHASGAVTSGGTAPRTGYQSHGGLVGSNAGSISDSDASGSVTSSGQKVGGLVGWNSGTLTRVHATGVVTGTDANSIYVGGLVGYHTLGGIIDTAWASGEVTSASGNVGGLVGRATGSLAHVWASGKVTGGDQTGGLVGFLGADLTDAYATGDVSGSALVGGLVGSASGHISASWASGKVQGSDRVGGLAGKSSAYISHSWASGAVVGGNDVGGLVGYNLNATDPPNLNGVISDSYATGSVSATGDNAGGLVGSNNDGASINTSYATGKVSGTGNMGALVGLNSVDTYASTVTNSYWVSDTSDQANGIGHDDNNQAVTSLTLAQLMAALPAGFDASTWANANNQTTPYLSALAHNSVYTVNDSANRYDVIQNAEQLQAVNDKLSGNFVLANNIDASDTVNWNSGAGFAPIGSDSNPFTGLFDGLYHTINGLFINSSSASPVGLFGVTAASAVLSNIGLEGGSITVNGANGASGVDGADGSSGSNGAPGTTGQAGASVVAGALVGENHGAINSSYAHIAVTANGGYGGDGGNGGTGGDGTILAVTHGGENGGDGGNGGTGGIGGNVTIGGLVGANDGSIADSYASGTVTGQAGSAGYGGNGGNGGNGGIDNANNGGNGGDGGDGSVGGIGGKIWAGGLIGNNTGSVTNSYAIGQVAASAGFRGEGGRGGHEGLGNSAGSVSGVDGHTGHDGVAGRDGDFAIGGLLGASSGSVTASFWNTDSSGQTSSAGGTGLSSADMMTLASFADWDIDDAGGTGKIWRIYAGYTTPLLRAFLTSFNTVAQPDYDGSGATLANIGSVTFTNLPSSHIYGSAAGSSADTLTLSSTSAGSYTASSNASSTGLYSDQQGYDLITGTATRTISTPGSAAGEVQLPANLVWTSGTLIIDTTGAVTTLGASDNHTAISGGRFLLQNGNWVQNSAGLPVFAVTDFQLAGGSFVRALGGDGSSANPYQLTDVYGLQGIDTLLDQHFVLANDIDASASKNWSAGFKSIGNLSSINSSFNRIFTGSLDGQSHSISGLFINDNISQAVGLFIFSNGTISHLGLLDANISTGGYAGGLIGYMTGGSLTDVYATGSVFGGTMAGGLVGHMNGGLISQSHADMAVTGKGSVGGLVGKIENNGGTLVDVYATGDIVSAITGNSGYVGGLVGDANNAHISRAYASGKVTANFKAGGLVGYLGATSSITDSYATGDVETTLTSRSTASQAGGLVGRNDGSISTSYATGHVTVASATDYAGGLVGDNNGSISNSYWNSDSLATGVGNNTGSDNSAGKTLTQLQQPATFTGWAIDDEGGTGNTWRIYEGYTTPLLRSFLTQLDVGLGNQSQGYDGASHNLADLVHYSFTPEASHIQGSLGSATARNVGDYTLTGSALYSDQLGYDIRLDNSKLTITPAAITISSSDVTKVYDGLLGANGSAVVTSGTLFGTDSLSGGSFAFSDKNVGNGKTVTVADVSVDDGNSGNNYTVSYADNTTSSISALGITATLNADDKTYDGNKTAAVHGALSGVISGDDVSMIGSGTFNSANAGPGTVNVSASLSGADAGNYQLTTNSVAYASINKRDATVTANSATVQYNGQTQSVTGFTATGLVSGENETVLAGVTESGGTGINAGSYAHTLGGGDINYSLTFVDGTLTIKGANPLTGSAQQAPYEATLTALYTPFNFDEDNDADSLSMTATSVALDVSHALATPESLTRLAQAAPPAPSPEQQAAELVQSIPVTLLRFPLNDPTPADSEALRQALQPLASFLIEHPQVQVTVTGYTDNTGSERLNARLSQQRAKSVVTLLEQLGVKAQQLHAIGGGYSHPVADNKTVDGRAQNRRVQVVPEQGLSL